MNHSLDPIDDSPLGTERAKHLLNRTLLGYPRAILEQCAQMTINEVLDMLLEPGTTPGPPLQVFGDDPNIAFGESWVDAAPDGSIRSARKKSLRSWWVGSMLNAEPNLSEKMVLFWHNHFATEVNVVNIPAYYYQYLSLIRENALGNFKDLTGAMTVNTAMLKYLDGVKNSAASPNENYSRELFELFTIGKGPLLGEGNYSFYTEQDVQEGARVLTGWRINQSQLKSVFNANQHDKSEKVFSGYYDNQRITDQGDKEYLALMDMIFSKKQTARSLVMKLYRWFLYYKIDDELSDAIIEPLTDLFYDHAYEVKPLLRKFLSSQHFFSPEFRGCFIKSPVEFVIGSLSGLEVSVPEDLSAQYEFWNLFWSVMRDQELEPGTPPDVAGWPAYYKEPQFNQLWLNAATLPQKSLFIRKLIHAEYRKNGIRIQPDCISLAQAVSDPSDPETLINGLCEIFLPVEISQSRLDSLKELLIPGLPDSVWTFEWNKYVGNPDDPVQKGSIEGALKLLLDSIMNLPEYYLL
jgi:uncharacterized protein (DUF1800 family)